MDLLMPPWAAALLILCAMPYLTETYDHADSVVYQNEPDVMLSLPSTAEHTSIPLVFRLGAWVGLGLSWGRGGRFWRFLGQS